MEITELQKDLAATFRWTARLNMHEAVANHFSACVPESSNFYVNKAGIHFSRMRASDLILVCLLYTSPSPRDKRQSRMPSSA